MTDTKAPLQTPPQLAPHVGEVLPKQSKADPRVTAFASGRNERTLKAYRQDLDDFRSFLGKETLPQVCADLLGREPGDANHLVLFYKKDLRKRGFSAATINHRLAALRSLTKLGRLLGLCSF